MLPNIIMSSKIQIKIPEIGTEYLGLVLLCYVKKMAFPTFLPLREKHAQKISAKNIPFEEGIRDTLDLYHFQPAGRCVLLHQPSFLWFCSRVERSKCFLNIYLKD